MDQVVASRERDTRRVLLVGERRRQWLLHRRDLVRELVVREMKLRYKRSVLGIAWSLVNPLAQVLILSFLFRIVLPVKVANYSSFVFAGVLAWTWFQSSLLLATGAITDNRELVRRPGFPVAILPIVTVTTSLIHFALALPVLLVFLLIDGSAVSIAYLALPLVIAVQFLLTLGLAYVLAAIHVTFRDTQHLLALALLLLFYLTPVFYEVSAVPQRYRLVYRLNPMAWMLDAYRSIFLRGAWPEVASLLVMILAAGVILAIGFGLFTRASRRFVEEL